MKVLVGCEFSQIVTKAFRERGHEAYSCDILPTEGNPDWHIEDDVLNHLNDSWDIMIAHPPCTYLSKAGARWLHQGGKINEKRYKQGIKAREFFMNFFNTDIPRVAIENPTPLRIYNLPRYTQIIQPYMFGHPFSKRTLLWLKGLPKLKVTEVITDYSPYLPSNTGGRKRGQKFSKGIVHNSIDASRTFPGIAKALAIQYTAFVNSGMSIDEWNKLDISQIDIEKYINMSY